MSEEEEYDGEKTQIWLPGGGGAPGAAPKPADDDNKGTLLKPAKAANRAKTETGAVDFDITSDGNDAAPADGAESKAAATAHAARTRAAVAENSASSGASFGTVIIVVIVAAIAWFLLR